MSSFYIGEDSIDLNEMALVRPHEEAVATHQAAAMLQRVTCYRSTMLLRHILLFLLTIALTSTCRGVGSLDSPST